MTTQQTPFPPQIAGLPAFEGPFDAHRLAAESCDVLFATYPASTIIAEHKHETDNVGVITTGELILIVDGDERRYGPGDWYHVSPGQSHAARFEQPTCEIEFWFQPPASDVATTPPSGSL